MSFSIVLMLGIIVLAVGIAWLSGLAFPNYVRGESWFRRPHK